MIENEKQEDYMGMISWSRTCGSARPLFGTEIETANPIELSISHAEESRDLSRILRCRLFNGLNFLQAETQVEFLAQSNI